MTDTIDLAQLGTLLRDAVAAGTPVLPELLTAEEAAQRLRMSDKVFRAEVRARKIRYILVGRRKKFTVQDLAAYVAAQRDAPPCPSTSRKARPTTTTTSSSKVIGITALLESRNSKKRRP